MSAVRVEHETVDDAVITHVFGDLDLLTTPELLAHLDQACTRARPGQLVVADLAGVAFLGSAGLSALLEVNQRCEQRHTPLWIIATKPGAVRPLQVTGLDRILNVANSLDGIVRSA